MLDPALFAIGLLVTLAVAVAVGLVGLMDVHASGDDDG